MDVLPVSVAETHKILYILDIVGVCACSVAGTVAAKRVGLDLSGAVLVSFISSVGGGTLRDLLLNRHPVFWLHDLNYLYFIFGISIIVQIFYHTVERLDKAMRWFDALGLAAFTIIGLEAALSKAMPAPIVLMMGVFTAIIGGIFRDIVCRQIPLVLQKEIYSTAAIIGGIYYLLLPMQISLWVRDVSTLLLIFSLRMLAVYRNWNLPNITLKTKSSS